MAKILAKDRRLIAGSTSRVNLISNENKASLLGWLLSDYVIMK